MRWFIAILIFFLSSGPLFADRILMKSGQVLNGKIIRQSRKDITVRLASGVRTVSKTQVRRVFFGKNADAEMKKEEALQLAALKTKAEQELKAATDAKQTEAKKEEAEQEHKNQRPTRHQEPVDRTNIMSALWRSALVPGWGQYYQGRIWSGVAYGGLFLGAAGAVYSSNGSLVAARSDLDAAASFVFYSVGINGLAVVQATGNQLAQDSLVLQFLTIGQRNSAAASVKSAQSNLNIAGGILATVYLVNLADVVLFAPDKQSSFDLQFYGKNSVISYTLRF